MKTKFLKQWRFTLILMGSVIAGALLGYFIGPKAQNLKPLGDVFLNLLFTAVVPLVFFSLSSAIASNSDLKRLGRMAGLMLVVFIVTGIKDISSNSINIKQIQIMNNLFTQLIINIIQKVIIIHQAEGWL